MTMDSTQSVEIQIINAFVDNGKGGNAAGLVLDADLLSNDQKLYIAQKVGLSETAFISKSKLADFKLDFFTPTRQIAHCGHATIAAFSYLSQLGKIRATNSSKETIDGKRDILIKGELAFMEQKAPGYQNVSNNEAILTSLGLMENDLISGATITIVNTGNSFAIIPVIGKNVLKKIKPDFDLIKQISEALDLIGYYVFSIDTDDSGRDATTRMFAPRYGIDEESGTGMAAGPLACYLYDLLGIKKERYLIQQGWFMNEPSPSLIIVNLTLSNNEITKIMVGGKGIVMDSINVELQ